MTVVQFPTRSEVDRLSTSAADAITPQRFKEAHEMADELDVMPTMSAETLDFMERATEKANEAGGYIQADLLAMPDALLDELEEFTDTLISSGRGFTTEADYIANLVADEVLRRRHLTPDGAA